MTRKQLQNGHFAKPFTYVTNDAIGQISQVNYPKTVLWPLHLHLNDNMAQYFKHK